MGTHANLRYFFL